MPDLISNAKEIYLKVPKEMTEGTNKIVPIRGIYVTGEYKPPLYVDAGIQLLEIDSEPAEIYDYTTAHANDYDPTAIGLHLYDAWVDTSVEVDDYRTTHAPDQTDETSGNVHLYDVFFNPSMRVDWYTRTKAPDQTDGISETSGNVHLYDISIDPTQVNDFYKIIQGGSAQEPIIRITEIFTEVQILNVE